MLPHVIAIGLRSSSGAAFFAGIQTFFPAFGLEAWKTLLWAAGHLVVGLLLLKAFCHFA